MTTQTASPAGDMAQTGQVMNRWWVVVGAILIQLCLGAIYAWSVFTAPLKASSPADIVDLYSASQLGLDADKYRNLNAELKGPRDELKKTKGALKAETDAQKKKALKARQTELDSQVSQVVSEHVAADRLDAFSYGFSNTKTQAIFSAGLAAFAIVMVLAGRAMPKVGPRFLAVAAGIVLGLGYVLAGIGGGKSFPLLFIFIGVIGGAGIGLGYVVPIAVGMKWFPDKKGLITGLAVAGFGFGALLWVKLAGPWGSMIADLGLRTTFTIYGIVFLIACLIGSIWMLNPPEGWRPAGWTPPAPKPGTASGAVDFTSSQMLSTPQFYAVFLCFVFGAGAGLMSIGLMSLFPSQALVANGMDVAAANAVASTAMAVFFALANGIGRIAWGTISDRIGRKPSIFVMLATQGVIVILFQWMAGHESLLYLGATLIGFNFGGNFALFPTITADTFGTKHLAQNYGWVFLAYGIGGILGPILGGRLGDLGNFQLAFTICGALCLAAAGLIALVKPPRHAVAPVAGN